jgi:hypothetical protein
VLVKALAGAWRWQKLLDRRVYSSVTEIAEAEKISKSDMSRILRLALLAPDIVEAILGGWADQRVMLVRLEWPLPMGWGERHTLFWPAESIVGMMCSHVRRVAWRLRPGLRPRSLRWPRSLWGGATCGRFHE